MVVYGKQIVELIASKHPKIIKEIYLSKEIDKSFFARLKGLNKPILKIDNKKAQALAKGGNHQGFFLEIESLMMDDFANLKAMDSILVLSNISDVGNLGSLVRSACALGFGAVIFCEIKDLKQEGIIRVSAGALLEIPFCVIKNTLDVANELRQAGFTLFGTDLKGENKNQFIQGKKALFLGNEGEGLQKRVLAKMDKILTIPMKRDFDSLNVGVAGAILMDRIVYGRA